jgi:hypothetical protein
MIRLMKFRALGTAIPRAAAALLVGSALGHGTAASAATVSPQAWQMTVWAGATAQFRISLDGVTWCSVSHGPGYPVEYLEASNFDEAVIKVAVPRAARPGRYYLSLRCNALAPHRLALTIRTHHRPRRQSGQGGVLRFPEPMFMFFLKKKRGQLHTKNG